MKEFTQEQLEKIQKDYHAAIAQIKAQAQAKVAAAKEALRIAEEEVLKLEGGKAQICGFCVVTGRTPTDHSQTKHNRSEDKELRKEIDSPATKKLIAAWKKAGKPATWSATA